MILKGKLLSMMKMYILFITAERLRFKSEICRTESHVSNDSEETKGTLATMKKEIVEVKQKLGEMKGELPIPKNG